MTMSVSERRSFFIMTLFGEKVKCVENYLVTKLENLRINGVFFDVLILTTLGIPIAIGRAQ